MRHIEAQPRQFGQLRFRLGDAFFHARRRLAVVAQRGERLVGQGVDGFRADQRLDVE